MVGYEFLDHDAIGESHIGISVADATDYTKSESDLVLTQHALMPVSSAVQISRKICQMMRSFTVGHSDAFGSLISDNMFCI
jgi:H+-transporting ATPase